MYFGVDTVFCRFANVLLSQDGSSTVQNGMHVEQMHSIKHFHWVLPPVCRRCCVNCLCMQELFSSFVNG